MLLRSFTGASRSMYPLDGQGCAAAGIHLDGTEFIPDIVNVNTDGSLSEIRAPQFDPFQYFGPVAATQRQARLNLMNVTPTPQQAIANAARRFV